MGESIFLIRVDDFSGLRSLVDFLQRKDYRMVHARHDAIAVSAPEGVSDESARVELDRYLSMWQKSHQGGAARLAD